MFTLSHGNTSFHRPIIALAFTFSNAIFQNGTWWKTRAPKSYKFTSFTDFLNKMSTFVPLKCIRKLNFANLKQTKCFKLTSRISFVAQTTQPAWPSVASLENLNQDSPGSNICAHVPYTIRCLKYLLLPVFEHMKHIQIFHKLNQSLLSVLTRSLLTLTGGFTWPYVGNYFFKKQIVVSQRRRVTWLLQPSAPLCNFSLLPSSIIYVGGSSSSICLPSINGSQKKFLLQILLSATTQKKNKQTNEQKNPRRRTTKMGRFGRFCQGSDTLLHISMIKVLNTSGSSEHVDTFLQGWTNSVLIKLKQKTDVGMQLLLLFFLLLLLFFT